MNITLIGAGNLAFHLCKALIDNGHTINQVFSRTTSSAQDLAKLYNIPFTTQISDIQTNADLIILSVKDSAINEILTKVNFKNTNVVHTAGSVSIEVLAPYCKNYGVFYPLQTFSKIKPIDFQNIPICIEANNNNFQEILIKLAKSISSNVNIINTLQRKQIHLAAVFACNFSNYLYSIANTILKDNNLNFNILSQLIKETAEKALNNNPFEVQTGPAVRKDYEIINQHLELLGKYTDFKEIYKILTDNIIKNLAKNF